MAREIKPNGILISLCVASLMEYFADPADISVLLSKIGVSISTSLCSGFISRCFETRRSPAESILNGDLRKLAAAAMGDVVSITGDKYEEGKERKAFLALGQELERLWMDGTLEKKVGAAPLDEAALPELIRRSMGPEGVHEILTPGIWRDILDQAQGGLKVGKRVSEKGLIALSEALHMRFASMLKAKLKDDFAGAASGRGRGYAALQLMMLSSMATDLRKLTQIPAPVTAMPLPAEELAHASEALLRKMSQMNLEKVIRLQFERLTKQERQHLHRVLDDVAEALPEIRGKLKDISDSLADMDAEQRDRHESMKRMMITGLMLICVVLLGLVSFGRPIVRYIQWMLNKELQEKTELDVLVSRKGEMIHVELNHEAETAPVRTVIYLHPNDPKVAKLLVRIEPGKAIEMQDMTGKFDYATTLTGRTLFALLTRSKPFKVRERDELLNQFKTLGSPVFATKKSYAGKSEYVMRGGGGEELPDKWTLDFQTLLSKQRQIFKVIVVATRP